MKPETKLLKPGELSDEIQDYKIIELERYTSKQFDTLTVRQDEIIKTLTEIKEYMFNSQDKRIHRLERRVDDIEKRHQHIDSIKQEKTKQKNENRLWFNRTIAGAMITQAIGILIMLTLLYFGLK